MPRKMWTSLGLALLIATGASSQANAAVTIGSAMDGGALSAIPTNCQATTLNVPFTCTAFNTSISDGGGAAPGGVYSPVNGVIVRWRVSSGMAGAVTSITMTPRVFSFPVGQITARRSGTPRALPLPGGGTELVFDERLKISALDRFGLDITTVGSPGAGPYMVESTPVSARYTTIIPPIPDGITQGFGTSISASTTKLPINADIEPDIDDDGYGDETQDSCPQRADIHSACAPPIVTGLTFTKAHQFAFSSDEAANSVVTIESVKAGRKAGKKCKAGAKRGKKCTSYTKIAEFDRAIAPGVNTISYAYKVGGKDLKPGKYRATIVLTDAQNLVTTKTVTFSIKKPKKKKKK